MTLRVEHHPPEEDVLVRVWQVVVPAAFMIKRAIKLAVTGASSSRPSSEILRRPSIVCADKYPELMRGNTHPIRPIRRPESIAHRRFRFAAARREVSFPGDAQPAA
jgi:hypothetical protein